MKCQILLYIKINCTEELLSVAEMYTMKFVSLFTVNIFIVLPPSLFLEEFQYKTNNLGTC